MYYATELITLQFNELIESLFPSIVMMLNTQLKIINKHFNTIIQIQLKLTGIYLLYIQYRNKTINFHDLCCRNCHYNIRQYIRWLHLFHTKLICVTGILLVVLLYDRGYPISLSMITEVAIQR